MSEERPLVAEAMHAMSFGTVEPMEAWATVDRGGLFTHIYPYKSDAMKNVDRYVYRHIERVIVVRLDTKHPRRADPRGGESL